MNNRIEALVEPAMLRWSRRSAGYDIQNAAKKAQVRPEALGAWEQGDGHPSISQLRKLANVYKRPLAVFYLPEPPDDFQPIQDYRRLFGRESLADSPFLLYQIRRAYTRREQALELLALSNEVPPTFDHIADIKEDPEEVGARIRLILGVDYYEQVRLTAGYDTLNFWRRLFERNGVLVFQAEDVDLSTARGFSISLIPLPAVVANVKDAISGRIFTMFHELSHILLRRGGVCDLNEDSSRLADEERIEIFCNHAAGAALVPASNLLDESPVRPRPQRSELPEQDIHWLAERYGVSREVILRRLLILGKTTQGFYEEKCDQYQYEYLTTGKKGGFALPHNMAISTAGYTFVRLVLENYRQETISASDVAEMLDVRLKHLRKIEASMKSALRDTEAAT